MKFGVILPNLGGLADPPTLTRLTLRAEELGFDGAFVSDHLALPTTPGSRYPYRSDGAFPLRPDEKILEPVTTLAYLSAVTSRISLGFSVLVLPYRHAVLNAKMLSTLDVYSGGRLIVGVGVGWMKEEFDVLDSDYENRGQVTDEHIRLLQALWRRDEPDFAGNYYRFSGMTMYPKPSQKPYPPIWTGGITPRRPAPGRAPERRLARRAPGPGRDSRNRAAARGIAGQDGTGRHPFRRVPANRHGPHQLPPAPEPPPHARLPGPGR